MDELDYQKIIKKIIYKELEPSVLNESIITKVIIDQSPEGEAGRIFRNAEIQYDKISVLRLEFLNILKIDHLWILPNLKVLSLAFNKIDQIENLDSLVKLKELNLTYNKIVRLANFDKLKNLEILSVFGNQIKKIENIDCLDNLQILSAGNNCIETKDGIERLRFLKKLRALNLKGNAVEKGDKFFRIFIAGLLPNLTYYENKHISREQRDEGKDRFRFILREIMDNEKAEVEERERVAREKEENIHLMKCFVENLDKHQLFESLFVFDNEDQGECLLKIGGEVQNLIAEFHDQSFVITQRIFNIGLEQFQRRSCEQNLFTNCVKMGKKKIQVQGQKTIDDFAENRDKMFDSIEKIIFSVETFAEEDVSERITKLSEDFNRLHDHSWKSLMENEMHLHESVIETNTIFEHVIQDMMNEFIEKCKSQFVLLREVESNFIDALTEAVQSFVTLLASSGRENDIPEDLRSSLIDRDIIINFSAGMREMHMQKIDGREDLLVGRSNEWTEHLCNQLAVAEIERNRQKVMEINYYLDNQQITFDQLTTGIREKLSNTKNKLKEHSENICENFEEICEISEEVPLI